MKKQRPLTAVGAYIFAGGFTLGIEKSFDVLAHLEHGTYGVETFKLNRPHIPVWTDHAEWPDAFDAPIDLVYCNPPCALFSAAGASIMKGKGNAKDSWRTDPRVACWDHCFSLLERYEPQVLLIESVPLALSRGRELLDSYAARAMEMGYAVTHLLEDARWHGAPQKRPRYIFAAHRMALDLERHNFAPPPTVMETIGHLRNPGYHYPLQERWMPTVKVLKQGEGLRGAWERVNPPETWVRGPNGVKGRPRFCEHRLRADAPMGAYIGDFFIHPTQDRRIGLNEAKALCGFPAEFKFSNDKAAFSELARGVLPPVGAWLGRSAAAAIRRGAPIQSRVGVLDLRTPEGINDKIVYNLEKLV